MTNSPTIRHSNPPIVKLYISGNGVCDNADVRKGEGIIISRWAAMMEHSRGGFSPLFCQQTRIICFHSHLAMERMLDSDASERAPCKRCLTNAACEWCVLYLHSLYHFTRYKPLPHLINLNLSDRNVFPFLYRFKE